MATIESRLLRFSKIYVLVPVLTVTIVLNLVFAYLALRAPSERVERLREDAEGMVRSGMDQLEFQAQQLSVNPLVIASVKASEDRYRALKTAGTPLREVIQSGGTGSGAAIAASFTDRHPLAQRLAEADNSNFPSVKSFLLTDHLGRLVAASELPSEDNLSLHAWWKNAKGLLPGETVLTGMTEEDTVFMTLPVYVDTRGNSVDGVLRIEFGIEQILSRVQPDQLPEYSGLVFVRKGSSELHTRGNDKEAMERNAEQLVEHIRTHGRANAWFRGARFSVGKMKFGDRLQEPLNSLLFIEEPMLASDSVSPIVLSLFASAIFVVIVNLFGQKAALGVGRAVMAVTNAGQWLLWRVDPDQFTAEVGRGDRGILQNPIYNEWLEGVKQSVLDTMVSHEHEVQRDLQLARDFQFAYHNRAYPKVPLNHLPGRLRLRFCHDYQPALALGGDFFEISSLGPDVAALMICDVMGHGTRSALITSMLRTLMADLKSQGRNTRNFLREMNRSFYKMLQQLNLPHPLFASAYYFVADVTARAATFSTAGHPAPYHIRRSANTVSRLEVAPPHGAAMGVSLDEDYTGGSCRLNHGDVFIFYTDGVYEAFSPHGEEFGMKRLEAIMRKSIHHSLETIVADLRQAVNDFTEHEPLRDDICILGMEVTEEADFEIIR